MWFQLCFTLKNKISDTKGTGNKIMYNEIDFSKVIAVSNRHLTRLPYLDQVERICSFQPRAFLLREKDLPVKDYLNLALAVKKICDRHQVTMIPHFYPEAADAADTDVLHLPLWKLKELKEKGAGRLTGMRIGVSIHSTEEAEEAAALGASYATAGHIFATDCKKGLPPRGLDFLKQICDRSPIPIYAIGGIRLDPEQIQTVLKHGASGVCIMSQMMGM